VDETFLRAVEGRREIVGADRLVQVSDRAHFRRQIGVLLERGHEGNQRPRCAVQHMDDAKPIESGHVHVEEKEVGRFAFDQFERLIPGAGSADHQNVIEPFEQLQQERACRPFVVCDSHAKLPTHDTTLRRPRDGVSRYSTNSGDRRIDGRLLRCGDRPHDERTSTRTTPIPHGITAASRRAPIKAEIAEREGAEHDERQHLEQRSPSEYRALAVDAGDHAEARLLLQIARRRAAIPRRSGAATMARATGCIEPIHRRYSGASTPDIAAASGAAPAIEIAGVWPRAIAETAASRMASRRRGETLPTDTEP
jgi:hypothetical protein